jgi:YD repeat-containing protein
MTFLDYTPRKKRNALRMRRAAFRHVSGSSGYGAGFGIAAAAMLACAGPVWADVLPPKVISTTPGGVNIADGSFVYTQTDLTIGPLTLERFHLGGLLDPDVPFFGPHMSHNFDIYVAETHASPSPYHPFNSYGKDYVHMGLSAPGPYTQEFTASPTPVPGSEDAMRGELDWVSGAYVYTDQDGTIYTFTPTVTAVVGPINPPMHTQRVASIVHPNGRTLTFSYNASGQLKEVSDSTGYAIVFDYGSTSSTDMNVVAACAFDLARDYVTPASTCSGAALKTSYGYTSGLLTSTVDVTGQTTTYSYTNDEIACIKPPGYTACKITNTMGNPASGTGWQVWQQTMAGGAVWQTGVGGTFMRDESYVPSDGDSLATVTDPAGKVTTYALTGTSPYSVTDPYGNVTQYRYTGGRDFLSDPSTPLSYGSMLTEVDFPEGNKISPNITARTRRSPGRHCAPSRRSAVRRRCPISSTRLIIPAALPTGRSAPSRPGRRTRTAIRPILPTMIGVG